MSRIGQQVNFRGMTVTVVRDGPPEIYLMPDGTFGCEFDNKARYAKTLKAISKIVGTDTKKLKVIAEYGSNQTEEAVTWGNNGPVGPDGSRLRRDHWYRWYLADKATIEARAQIKAEKDKTEKLIDRLRDELDKKITKLSKQITIVTKDNFTELLEKYGVKQ
jgi:hypothetical protein